LFGFIDDTHAAFKNFADNVVTKLVLNREKSRAPMFRICELKSSPAFSKAGKTPDNKGDFFLFSACAAVLKGFNTKQVERLW